MFKDLGMVDIDMSEVLHWIESNSDMLWSLHRDEINYPRNLVHLIDDSPETMFCSYVNSFIVVGDFLDNLNSVKELKKNFSSYKFNNAMLIFSKNSVRRHKDIARNRCINIGLKNVKDCHTVFWTDDGHLESFIRYNENQAVLFHVDRFHSIIVNDSAGNENQERVVISLL
jgi:predicted aminopeptidase